MNRKQFLLTLSVTIISGFLGGALSIWFVMPPSVLAQDEPGKQTIEAERFVLKDASGRMRAELSTINGESPVLRFYNKRGEILTEVEQGSIVLGRVEDPDAELLLLDYDGVVFGYATGEANLQLRPSYLSIGGAGSGEERVIITGSDSPGIQIADDKGFRTVLGSSGATFSGDSPRIMITDNEGFQAVLGSTGTVNRRTGRTNQTSAASLTLFGKDKKVLWSAP